MQCVRYRRARLNPKINPTPFFLPADYVDVLRKVVGLIKERHPFTIDAMVILPKHLHAVRTLPPRDADSPGRWIGRIRGSTGISSRG
ncbi:MAG: hypothetical protein BM485_11290 [Desulfobulbaceae bacterium DB1]|nr:MAG: hypothetical protein BM485_11290 [Desulfobulbaceae bacterium DB1]